MRKLGFWFACLGGAGTIALFFIRRMAWYASEASAYMSETAELIESTFWACILTAALGLLLLFISLFKKQKEDETDDEPYEEPYEEPYADPYPSDPYYDPAYAPAERPAPYLEYDPNTYPAPYPQPQEPVYPVQDAAGQETVIFTPEEWYAENPQSPAAVQPQEEDWTCELCGCRNPSFSRICAVCGSTRGSRL